MLNVKRSFFACAVILPFVFGCTTINVNDAPAVVEEVGNVTQKVCLRTAREPQSSSCEIVTEKQQKGEKFVGKIDTYADGLFATEKPVVLLTVGKNRYLCTSPVFYCFAVERR